MNETEPNDKSSIVILEDDNSLGLLLLEELKEHGFHVRHFTDGRKALSNIMTNPPVMIIVDLMLLDEYDGWWLINQLKANSKTERIPIIISSALEENEKSKLYKIDHYLTKPYPPSELSTVVLDILRKGNLTGEVMYPNVERE
ncbi:MAG: response regulator [Bacillaceae bacterium]|nr:response regulator [Bacillaceae bacterium]